MQAHIKTLAFKKRQFRFYTELSLFIKEYTNSIESKNFMRTAGSSGIGDDRSIGSISSQIMRK